MLFKLKIALRTQNLLQIKLRRLMSAKRKRKQKELFLVNDDLQQVGERSQTVELKAMAIHFWAANLGAN